MERASERQAAGSKQLKATNRRKEVSRRRRCVSPHRITVYVLALLATFLHWSSCFAMPKVDRIELPNHLKILVFEEHSIPAVTMELLVSAGSWRDPAETKGLANLTAKSVLLGARFMSFDDVNNKLDYMGASLEADCSKDFAIIGMQVLKKNFESAVELFTEVILHPSFPSADIDGQKDDIIGSLRSKEDDPLEVANRAFDRALFLESPYAGPAEGTEKSVAVIGTEEISKFYASFYRPNDSILVVGGDITPLEVNNLIVPKLIEWEAAEVPDTAFRKEFADGAVNVAIEKPLSQATIVIGCPAMDRASDDYYPFKVMNQILGSGDLTSRLMIELRIKRGLAYAVESYPIARKYAGSFQVVIQTKNASAKESIALAKKQLERLREEPVSERELQAAKSFLVGNFPLQYNTQLDIAKFLAQIEFYGLGSEYPDRYTSVINAVTSEDILRVAKKYLNPDNVTVIVGDLKGARLE